MSRSALVLTKTAAMNRPLVLLVDDADDSRELFAECLRQEGFDVVEAARLVEGIARARHDRPDLVLLDLSLPDGDGCDAARALKSDEATRAIPILALTGHAEAQARADALQAGCDGVLLKPCLPDELVLEVKARVSRRP